MNEIATMGKLTIVAHPVSGQYSVKLTGGESGVSIRLTGNDLALLKEQYNDYLERLEQHERVAKAALQFFLDNPNASTE